MMSDIAVPEVEIEEGEAYGNEECGGLGPETEGHYIAMDGLAMQYMEDPRYSTGEMENNVHAEIEALYADDSADDTVYTADMFNQDVDGYEDYPKSYVDDFANETFDEGSNSNLDDLKEESRGIPLSSFNKITKNVEIAEYETLQILYQLLYQRSAWDTQEVLQRRILEFSGFSFPESSEEFYNRKVMLQTQPNDILVKLGAVLALDIRMMLVDAQKARSGLITQIMEFISAPKKKTRKRNKTESAVNKSYSGKTTKQNSEVRKSSTKSITPLLHDQVDGNPDANSSPADETVNKCGCRNKCFSKFSVEQQSKILDHMKKLQSRRVLDNYLLSLMELKKIIRKPGTYEDLKKFKEVNYAYQVKIGKNAAFVCKGAFCTMHGIRITHLVKLQNRLKAGRAPKIGKYDHLVCSDDESSENALVLQPNATLTQQEAPQTESEAERLAPDPSKENISLSFKEINQTEEDLKDKITEKKAIVSKVLVEKIDLDKMQQINSSASVKEESVADHTEVKQTQGKIIAKNENSQIPEEKAVKKKLKDFPLVVQSLEDSPQELLIDVHFLLFLDSAEPVEAKNNILEFDGFDFDVDTEEYDERNEFLQRMSNKIITDVSRCLSLGLQSTKEDTVKNILSFLSKPEESYIRMSVVPLSLSDVELDDIGDMSDSDESITCEVVEKKVECIELISSGEESDKEDSDLKVKKIKPQKSPVKQIKQNDPQYVPDFKKVKVNTSVPINTPFPTQTHVQIPTAISAVTDQISSSSTTTRYLRDFETICKIVNTHPHEYLIDIYDLLYMQKHQPSTLRKDILDFSGFSFEKGTPEYVKRKQFLDRMLYNSVRRIYNTLIHNTTEVKVFSKPTMITEIFQFLFKLPDRDTSIRPLLPKPPVQQVSVPMAVGTTTTVPPPVMQLPNQTGKLSDLKRVFQRVACFPCEYLVDVHKLLFMTDCDAKSIRQNIFGFKGFSFGTDSQDFQQRKMYLEYLTFHSLRKISSVLTTRSVDLRNSTKHELATHLTQVLAEYCNNFQEDTSAVYDVPAPVADIAKAPELSTNCAVENIVVTPIIAGLNEDDVPAVSSSTNAEMLLNHNLPTLSSSEGQLSISIVEAHSLNSPQVTTTSGSNKRKSQTIAQLLPKQPEPSQYADIHLPEVEQYCKLYGQNLNYYATGPQPVIPTITGITTFNTNGISHLVPQTIVHPYPQPIQVQNPFQQGGPLLLSTSVAPTMITSAPITVQNKSSELIVPVECVLADDEPLSKRFKSMPKNEISPNKKTEEGISLQNKNIRDAIAADDEDCDKPLASLIGHPIDTVIKKHIVDIVDQTDLQDITINGVIQKIFNLYPKFDLTYRKEFIKSTLRSILYRLGNSNSSSTGSEGNQIKDSSDCAVSTTGNRDSLSGSLDSA